MPRKTSPASGPAAHGEAQVLARRVAQGDRQALEETYRREAGPVYRYALALCGNPAWAADATQDAFVGFAQQAEAFDPLRGSLGAYLAGMARHRLLALWRQERRESLAADREEEALEAALDAAAGAGLGGAPAPVSPEELLVRRQSTAALWEALRSLPLHLREAVLLVDLQERPYAEAAQVAGIELNTLRTRLHRGRNRLAALLNAGPGAAAGPQASAADAAASLR